MQKKYLLPLAIATILGGCSSKEHLATVEPTDYAMSCNALINEINLVRNQFEDTKNVNTAKDVVGAVMTLGIYGGDDEKEIMLRERAKSLQTIYAIKQAKGECNELSSEQARNENPNSSYWVKSTKQTIDDTKIIINETKKATKEIIE